MACAGQLQGQHRPVKKVAGLRRLLLTSVPGLAGDADRLQTFVDEGSVTCRLGNSLAFELGYKLNIVVLDYAGATHDIFLPVLAWISEQQPELLQRADGKPPFTFTAEIQDSGMADIAIDLELTERNLVHRLGDGRSEVEALPEPDISDNFPGVCGVNLWQLFLNELLALESSDPAYTGRP